MFEVLEGATDYVKTHYHASQGGNNGAGGGGGSPTYFKRPFDKFIKAAAIFNEAGAVTIKYLSDDFDFGSSTSYEGLAGAVTNPSVYKVPS